MKKIILFAAMMAVAVGANAQWLDFSNNARRFEVGVHLGLAGTGTNFTGIGWGGNLNVCGVYVDVLKAGPMYKYDNHIDVGPTAMVPDSTAMTISVGYQIPILSWLYIMPVVGHCHTTSGYTDFSTVNVEVNGSDNYTSAEMYHDYVKVGASRHYFNFGGGVVLAPVKWFSLYGVYTKHAAYGGLSINLTALYEREGE